MALKVLALSVQLKGEKQMSNQLKIDVPQNQQTRIEHDFQSLRRENAATFRVRTGVNAGGFFRDRYQGDWYPGKYWDEWIRAWTD